LLPSEALQVTVSVASNVPVRRVPVETLGQLQTIADDDDDFVPPAEMIQRLLDDNRHIAEAQREAIDVCDQNNDSPTGNLLQEMLDQTERRIWFLFEISQGADNTCSPWQWRIFIVKCSPGCSTSASGCVFTRCPTR
jgi:hypothetical protein